eukprot:m.227030 g.227030  ORF g.227030 m.227030 type:complete len:138 (+) comp40036_c0_seq2:42-455(+)
MGFWHHLLPSLASVLLLATAGDALRRNLEESSFETVNVYEGSGRLRRSLRQATSKNRMAITVENKQRKWTLDLQRNRYCTSGLCPDLKPISLQFTQHDSDESITDRQIVGTNKRKFVINSTMQRSNCSAIRRTLLRW